jgi:hypothetical protein
LFNLKTVSKDQRKCYGQLVLFVSSLDPSQTVDKISFSVSSLPNDDELSALGIQGLKEDLLDKVVKLNVEYR